MKNLKKSLAAPLVSIFLGATLLTAVGCSSTPTKEGTGEYIDDSVITTKVKSLILKDESLKTSTEISVETFKGVVQLSGFVSSQAAANKAVSIASSVGGVKSVKNDIRVK
ncbi:MAG TPA: BON domain-containing protein [Rhodocyclaceae bacterium]|nr:BON domain-containing protein [Rhodocyclaceae bacterium]